MKKALYAFSCLFFALQLLYGLAAYSQPVISWGKKFEMKKSTSDLKVVNVDQSGEYLEEAEQEGAGLLSPGKSNTSFLIKMSPDLEELFRKDYDKELKGKGMAGLVFVEDKLYIFASTFDKKEKNAYLYAAGVDKGTGQMKGDWQQVYAWYSLDKPEEVQFRISPNADHTGILVSSIFTFSNTTQGEYHLKLMDASLATVDSTVITNEFDPHLYLLQDMICVNPDRFVLVGQVYQYEEGKKKKAKNMDFDHYSVRIYDHEGKMVKDVRTDLDGSWPVRGALGRLKNELLLTTFYSDDKAKSVINGISVMRIDMNTGDVLSTHKKELNSNMITDVEDDDNKPKSGETTVADSSTAGTEGLATDLVFRRYIAAPDGGLVIIAEQYNVEKESRFVGNMMRNYMVYTSGNLYMSKISPTGDIEWLEVLPKFQEEEVPMKSLGFGFLTSALPFSVGFSIWWVTPNARPFYSGIGCLPDKDKLYLFLNDHEKNADVLQEGKKIKKVKRNFSKTDCYLLTLDMNNGKLTRTVFLENKDIPTPMPRLGSILNGTMYMVGRSESIWSGSSDVVLGKITTGK